MHLAFVSHTFARYWAPKTWSQETRYGSQFLPKRDSICEFWLSSGASPPNLRRWPGVCWRVDHTEPSILAPLEFGERACLAFTFAAP